MKIAVTGGAGFIGTELAKTIKAKHPNVQLTSIDIHQAARHYDKSLIVDVSDAEALKDALKGMQIVYHLAAEHRDDVQPVSRYYDVNVDGAKNLVAACEEHGIETIIFTSTVAVYGLDAGESVETSTPEPFNDYGHSKLQSEEVFEKWAASDQRNTLVTMRLVATFGPGNRGNIYTLMDQIARKKFVMVGSGKNKKSIAYVGNVAAFLEQAMSAYESGIHIFNYADKPDLDMNELVGAIRSELGMKGLGPKLPYMIGLAGGKTFDIAAQITGRTFPISTIRVQKFCANTIVNADKAHQSGFEAPYSLQDGLQQMIEAEFKSEAQAA